LLRRVDRAAAASACKICRPLQRLAATNSRHSRIKVPSTPTHTRLCSRLGWARHPCRRRRASAAKRVMRMTARRRAKPPYNITLQRALQGLFTAGIATLTGTPMYTYTSNPHREGINWKAAQHVMHRLPSHSCSSAIRPCTISAPTARQGCIRAGGGGATEQTSHRRQWRKCAWALGPGPWALGRSLGFEGDALQGKGLSPMSNT
jgi:hypothetical protein